jgi:hypothetical protein
MTLFSRGDDPHCHRVRIVLAAKGLEARGVECDPARPPEDLIDLNPFQSCRRWWTAISSWRYHHQYLTSASRQPAAGRFAGARRRACMHRIDQTVCAGAGARGRRATSSAHGD